MHFNTYISCHVEFSFHFNSVAPEHRQELAPPPPTTGTEIFNARLQHTAACRTYWINLTGTTNAAEWTNVFFDLYLARLAFILFSRFFSFLCLFFFSFQQIYFVTRKSKNNLQRDLIIIYGHLSLICRRRRWLHGCPNLVTGFHMEMLSAHNLVSNI